MTEETKDVFRRSLWLGVCWGLVSAILRLVFTDAFSLTRPVALGLATFITSLCAYPIFSRWPKARGKFLFLEVERFRFWHYAALSLVFAAAMFLIARLFGWK